MLDLFVKMSQLPGIVAEDIAPFETARTFGRRLAYVLFITLGLGLGSLVGLFLAVVTGLLPIAC